MSAKIEDIIEKIKDIADTAEKRGKPKITSRESAQAESDPATSTNEKQKLITELAKFVEQLDKSIITKKVIEAFIEKHSRDASHKKERQIRALKTKMRLLNIAMEGLREIAKKPRTKERYLSIAAGISDAIEGVEEHLQNIQKIMKEIEGKD